MCVCGGGGSVELKKSGNKIKKLKKRITGQKIRI